MIAKKLPNSACDPLDISGDDIAHFPLNATRDCTVASGSGRRPFRRTMVGRVEKMCKGEQTRQEIIRAAAPIFNQKGYEGAALSDLIRVASKPIHD
jgi:hypothetical protein